MSSFRNFLAKIALIVVATFIVTGCGGGGGAAVVAVGVITTTILFATGTRSVLLPILPVLPKALRTKGQELVDKAAAIAS
jgi:hypothetical protein